LSFFKGFRSEPWLDSPLEKDLSHLRPTHTREIGCFGQGEPPGLIAMDRQTNPGIRASAEQVSQSIANHLFLTAVEPRFDEIPGFRGPYGGSIERPGIG